MSGSDILPGSISPTIFHPEISNSSKRLTPFAEAQAPSQRTVEPDPHSNLEARKQDLERLLQVAGKHISGYTPNNSELSVGVDKEAHRIVVKLIDSKTKEVIRQIPPEEILRLARIMRKVDLGLLDEMA
jgi:flagellar protein FlaG